MLLPDRLDTRIADSIARKIEEERACTDTASPAWRERCEVARIAAYSDPERRVFLSHIAEVRGEAAATHLEHSARELRTTAIFFLSRKPS